MTNKHLTREPVKVDKKFQHKVAEYFEACYAKFLRTTLDKADI